jgi:hypothetical protein
VEGAYDALTTRSEQLCDYVDQQESARYDAIANATEDQYGSAVQQAETQYQQAVDEANRTQPGGGGP